MTHATPLLPAPTHSTHGSGPQPPGWDAAATLIAATPRQAACWAINIAIVTAAVGTGSALGWAWCLLFGITALTWELAGLVRTGRSPGHRVAGLRTVEKATGMPGRLGAVLARRCVTMDLRKGRDPLRLTPRPLPGMTAVPPPPRPAPTRAGAWSVVADDGSRLTIITPTLVGRNADDPSGRYATITIPDVSKTLSRNHALLEPTPEGLRVTDIGSGNGSAVADGDRLHRIGKYQSVTVAPGTWLMLGRRFFEVSYE